MTVGFPVTKGGLDLALGQLAIDTREMLTRAKHIADCLSGVTDEQLRNFGYSAEEVTLIRDVQTDVATLLQVFTGQAALAVPHDFMAYLGQLFGTK